MVLCPQYFIDDLKDRADLVRIIEPWAQLEKGSELDGVLSVSPRKRMSDWLVIDTASD